MLSLDLHFDLFLSFFDLPIHRSLGLFVILVNGLSFGTIDQFEPVSNTPGQFISTAIRLLDLCLLAYPCSLFARQVFGPSRVNRSTHPVGRMDQLRPRTRPPAYGLSVAPNHTGEVVAVEYGRTGLVHRQDADSVIGDRVFCQTFYVSITTSYQKV